MKAKNVLLLVFGAFVLAETAIYITYLIYELSYGINLIYLKYAGIITCLLFAGVGIFFYGKDGITVTVALAFTVVSDLFILVLNTYYEVGICTFIVVQICYFVRIYMINGKKPYISLGVRLGVVAVLLAVLGGLGMLKSAVVVLSAIYFPQLAINAVESAMLIRLDKKYIAFFIGLVLFAICDICVGVDNMAAVGGALPSDIQYFVNKTIWIVYLPAQVLIVLSEKKTEYKPFFKLKHSV